MASSTRSSWLIASSPTSQNPSNSVALLLHTCSFSVNGVPILTAVAHTESNAIGLKQLTNPSHLQRFIVASYNILADKNASHHTDLYVNIPSRYMKWNRRKKIICDELFELEPDIICLQEVDKYFEFSQILVKAGYAGSFKRRTGDSVDGCAMFWKAHKFRLLDGESIQYKDFGLRDNVAQLLVFEAQMCESDSRRLLVGNIHILYNPNRGEVKLGQIRFLSSRAKTLSEKWGHTPVILAGDFNSTPQSGIYKFLSSSELNVMMYDRKQLSGQKYCRPSQVLGEKKETVAPFIVLDGYFSLPLSG